MDISSKQMNGEGGVFEQVHHLVCRATVRRLRLNTIDSSTHAATAGLEA